MIQAIHTCTAKVVRHGRKRVGRAARGVTRATRGVWQVGRLAARQGRRLLSLAEPARESARSIVAALRDSQELFHYSVPGESSSCPACGASDIALLEPLPLSRRSDGCRVGFVSGCNRCGLVFANPFPSPEELEAFYTPEGEWGRRRTDEEAFAKAPPVAYVRELFGPAASSLDVTRPPTGGRVLDIGCGSGELLDAFRELGWETWGIEPSERGAFPRHRELSAVPTDASFHVVVLHHVLEHVAKPLDMLRAVAGALREPGIVAVSVPRLDALPLHRDVKYCISSRTHVVSYTRDCMATLFGLAGLAPLDVSRPLHTPPRKTYMLRRLQMLGAKGRGTAHPPSAPLRAARRAFRAYYESSSARPVRRFLPVRVRAALLNRSRIAASAMNRESNAPVCR